MSNPPLPELPPMKPAAAQSMAAPERAASPQSTSNLSRPGAVGTKRLRQIVTAIAGGGFTVVLVVLFFQLVARPGLRPTDLMATIEAQTELGVMNQKQGHKPGEMVLTEADYQAQIAEAQRAGQAKAELAFQKELSAVQADKERVVAAYQTLYQRANIIAQAALQMESLAQQFRQQLLAATNGGRSVVLMLKDMACGLLGDQATCASARADREIMIAEATELTSGHVGRKVRELMAGVDDPATFITQADQKRHGTPEIERQP